MIKQTELEQIKKETEAQAKILRFANHGLEKENNDLLAKKARTLSEIVNLEKQIPDLRAKVKVLQDSILTANGKLRDIERSIAIELKKITDEQEKNKAILADIQAESAKNISNLELARNKDTEVRNNIQKQVKERIALDKDKVDLDHGREELTKGQKTLALRMVEVDKIMAEVQEKLDAAKIAAGRAEVQFAHVTKLDKEAEDKLKELDEKKETLRRTQVGLDKKDSDLTSGLIKLEEAKKELIAKQNSLSGGYADLEKKKLEFEVLKLKFEKLAKDKGLEAEYEQLKEELGK